jgi:uncharacterized Zn finger protein (UPF0148 family)
MSDFDKEAEREKLRDKYERDQQKREATEQMSELLLKGATMTNSHCGTCGDPIFRYEGQEFCPTCEEVVAEQPAEGDAQTDAVDPADDHEQPAAGAEEQLAAGTEEPATETAQQPAQSELESTENGTSDVTEVADADPAQAGTGSAPEATPSPKQPGSTPASRPESQSAGSTPETAVSSGNQSETPADTPASGGEAHTRTEQGDSLATARASLTRTVTRLARQAEAADDLERARAYLTATEEAADALAAVKQADR